MVWVTNMYHFVPDLSIWKKCCDRCTLFMYVHHVQPSQQDSYGTVPPKRTLSKLNKWFYGATGNSFNYFDLFGVA